MKTIFLFLVFSISISLFAQTESIINYAIQLGEKWKFEEAISILKKEIDQNPNHAEAYYWLGRYSHYIVYDTRPFANKSDVWSKDEVLANLQKAVELKPGYGDAKYFLAAEYGARALEALKKNDTAQYKKEFTDAIEFGAFPNHILEHGRNILKSCDENAILIVQGDMQFNTLQYLQNIEGYRKDISVIVWALLERPFYIKLIRDGVDGILKPVPLKLSDNLIMEMHNYKWRTNDIEISLSEEVRENYAISDTIKNFSWTVKPDVGEKKLWSGTAIFINIMEENQFKRPIYFSFESIAENAGLADYLQNTGLAFKVLPFKVGSVNKYDRNRFENVLLNPENYVDFADIKVNEQPRVSFLVSALARRNLVLYGHYLLEQKQEDKATEVLYFMEKVMPEEIYPIHESLKPAVEDIRKKLKITQ